MITVVIPALNAEATLPATLTALVPAALEGLVREVIVVDGGSVDRTVEVARELRPDVKIVQQTRKGKGNALACGFAACTGDIIVMVDADGSADGNEIVSYVSALVSGADFAKGSRFANGGGTDDMTFIRRLGNGALCAIVNRKFGARYTDLCYGYNAFWADMVPLLDLPDHTRPAPSNGKMLWGDGFEIETVINCRFAAAGVDIVEVPSVELLRIHGESNLHAVSDGLRVLRTLFTEWRRTRGSKDRLRPSHRRPRELPAAIDRVRPVKAAA